MISIVHRVAPSETVIHPGGNCHVVSLVPSVKQDRLIGAEALTFYSKIVGCQVSSVSPPRPECTLLDTMELVSR